MTVGFDFERSKVVDNLASASAQLASTLRMLGETSRRDGTYVTHEMGRVRFNLDALQREITAMISRDGLTGEGLFQRAEVSAGATA